MIYVMGALLIMLLAAVIVALGYRGKAAAEQRHAELQKQRGDVAEANINQRRQLDTALESINETHREETIHATTATHLAERSDFDNDWSADAGLRGSETNSNHATGSAAAGSTGAAVDNVSRTDLSE